MAANSFADVIRGRGFFGLVSVEFPMSCSTPLDCLLLTPRDPDRVPEGETFSASETTSPLAEVEVLFGVTLRVGTAAARKPALRSCRRRVCREVPGPESGREGDGEGTSSSPAHAVEGDSRGERREAIVHGMQRAMKRSACGRRVTCTNRGEQYARGFEVYRAGGWRACSFKCRVPFLEDVLCSVDVCCSAVATRVVPKRRHSAIFAFPQGTACSQHSNTHLLAS